MLHLAADVNPRTEHDIVHQRIVAEPQDPAGMDDALTAVKRFAFAHAAEIPLGIFLTHVPRRSAEQSSRRKRHLVGRRALLREGAQRGSFPRPRPFAAQAPPRPRAEKSLAP